MTVTKASYYFYDDCTNTNVNLMYNVSSNITANYTEYQGYNTLYANTSRGNDGTLELKGVTVSENVDWVMTFDILFTNIWSNGGISIVENRDILSINTEGTGVHLDIRTQNNRWHTIKVIKQGFVYSVFLNDSLKGSVTNNNINSLKFNINGDTSIFNYYFKNIVIDKL